MDHKPRRCSKSKRVEDGHRSAPVPESTGAHRATRDQHHILKLASEAAGIGAFDWWIQDGIIDASPELEKLWGLERGASQASVDFWRSRVVPEDRVKIDNAFADWSGRHLPECAFDFRIMTAKAKEAWIHLRAKLEYSPSGQLVRMTGINMDITVRKQAEEALRRGEFWFRTLADNVPEILYLYEPSRGVTYINRRIEDLSGLPVESLCGNGFADLFHPDDRLKALETIYEAVASRKPYARTYRVRVADGSYHWFQGHAVPVEVDGGMKWFGIASDVDDQVRLEEGLKKTADDLRIANERLAQSNLDLQNFAMVVAHDLHTPLSTMATVVYSLCEECGSTLDAQAQEYLGLLLKSTEQMRSLLDAVLQYSRIDQNADRLLAPVDCSWVLANTISNLQSQIRSSGAVITAGQLPTVLANEAQLGQVLLNLIFNAMYFHKPDVRPRIHVSATESEQEWTLSVEDNGIGIAAKDADRIFEMFQRGRPEDKNRFGIGLAICEKVIEKHGGRIWVESTPGRGSRFSFTLPKAQTGRTPSARVACA